MNNKFWIRTVLIGLLLMSNATAQVTSPLLNCVDKFMKFESTAKFNGQTATVAFKGWTYDLRYVRAFVSSNGERRSVYENKEISVDTAFPYKKDLVIWTNPVPGSLLAISNCD
jgi:hypothetical protein